MTRSNLALSRMHFPITSLGYGRRVGLWTQGCSIRCKGCMSVDTWAMRPPDMPIDEVVARLEPWLREADGLTISGGEPFDQSQAVVDLLIAIRPRVAGDILLFSGYRFDEIPNTARPALCCLDAIVCGPFTKERASDLPLRGSDNQELRPLTRLGLDRYGEFEMRSTGKPRVDLVQTDGTLWFAGIPRPGDLDRLDAILSAHQFSFKTSAGRLGRRR
jgi:anaerobic ribonucleoside-triphosphate reductase activating protein